MQYLAKAAAFGAAGLMIVTGLPNFAHAQKSSTPAHSNWNQGHRVIIQVTQNDPAIMNMALNNAENLVKYYKDKGEKVQVEFVAYGAGLNMVRDDTSPVKQRLEAIATGMKNVTFTGCGNTLSTQSKQESKEISLLTNVRLTPSGIARVVELEEQGWTYVRP